MHTTVHGLAMVGHLETVSLNLAPGLNRIPNAEFTTVSLTIAKHLCKSDNLRLPKFKQMNTQTTALPKLFIGMDVHKKSWTVHFKTDLFDNKQ